MREEAGEGNAGAAGSPAVAAAGEERKFCGDKRREDIVSPRVTIPTFVEEIKGAEINSCVEAAMFLRVMAASEPGSPGESVDSQKATSPVAFLALCKELDAMKAFHAALVAGKRVLLDVFHAEGSLAPEGRKPGQEWNLAK